MVTITFPGPARPVVARLAEPVADLLPLVLPGWSGQPVSVKAVPDVRADQTPDGFRVEAATLPGGTLDVANAITAAGAVGGGLTAAYAGQTHGHIELHASACVHEGMAIVMVGGTGAGKSSLALQLARLGHRLMADDRIGIRIDDAGGVECTALGVAPKTRLPLRPYMDDAHRDFIDRWTQATYPGVAFLSLPSDLVTPLGGTVPAGVLLLLRREADGGPSLLPASVTDVVRIIVEHGLAPSLPATALVKEAERLARSLPAFWLRYSDSSQAAGWLPVEIAALCSR